MNRHDFKDKSFVQIIINQRTMTIYEFNALVSLLIQLNSKQNLFLKHNFRVLKPFRLVGDMKLLSIAAGIYYKAFIREGLIQNLKVVK